MAYFSWVKTYTKNEWIHNPSRQRSGIINIFSFLFRSPVQCSPHYMGCLSYFNFNCNVRVCWGRWRRNIKSSQCSERWKKKILLSNRVLNLTLLSITLSDKEFQTLFAVAVRWNLKINKFLTMHSGVHGH